MTNTTIARPRSPRYACAEGQGSPGRPIREPWTLGEKAVLVLFLVWFGFLIGIQVGRQAERDDAAKRFPATYATQDIG